ncbi:MAG: VWA domain-containing protein [Candidatus Omnitrophota bacterium]|nr:VWA domain-containing protein [Candidatus Omnitrophota bacterium]
MKNKPLVSTSVLVSILAHLLVFSSAQYIWVPGADALIDQTAKMFHLQKTMAEIPSSISREQININRVEKIKFERPGAEVKEMLKQSLKFSGEIKKPDTEMALKDLREDIEDLRTKEKPKEALLPSVENIEVQKRKVFDKETRIELDVLGAVQNAPESDAQDITIPQEFLEQMPAYTPLRAALSATRTRQKMLLGIQVAEAEMTYESIDEFLNVRTSVWRDPENNETYFQVAIFPGNETQSLEVMSKEIVFLVDASSSINHKRMHQFKNGIRYALENLNAGDSFNVITFKEKIDRFGETSVAANQLTVTGAMYFIDNIKTSRRTDLYGAFLESIKSPSAMHPSYIILLSDGVPTYGVTSSAKLIGKITDVNSKERSFFAFSGGARVNRFLLDFLSYQNRGWSEYSKSIGNISQKISELYDKIKNPVLVNVRFQLSQLDASQVFPKDLPDFYRDTEFVLYGKVKEPGKFSMRVLGEINGQTKELIFSQDLHKAVPGQSLIAERWAFNKIYHLISLMALHGPNPEAKEEIRRLSSKFGIRIPYEFENLV